MKFKLGDSNLEVGYSQTERELFRLIPSYPRRASSRDIAEKWYGAVFPYHGQSIVRGILSSLVKKVEHNGEPFRVRKSKRAGPHPIEFWLDKP